MVARSQFQAKYKFKKMAFPQEQATTYSGNSWKVYHGSWFKQKTLVTAEGGLALPCRRLANIEVSAITLKNGFKCVTQRFLNNNKTYHLKQYGMNTAQGMTVVCLLCFNLNLWWQPYKLRWGWIKRSHNNNDNFKYSSSIYLVY